MNTAPIHPVKRSFFIWFKNREGVPPIAEMN
jgi:hypothetical protein